jgi:hypothetical protein
MQDECKPGYWAVIYHAKITPTRSGDFSLAGYGDDYLVVRINGVNVLDSGGYPPTSDRQLDSPTPTSNLKPYDAAADTNPHPRKVYPPGPWLKRVDRIWGPAYCQTVVGDKFHINQGDVLTIDILIGDAFPAGNIGRCGYFLYLLEDKEYGKDAQGNDVFPLFQIHADPNVKRDGEYPPFTCRPEDALIGSVK